MKSTLIIDDDYSSDEDFAVQINNDSRTADDALINPALNRHIETLLAAITSVGGDVAQMNAEMHQIAEENRSLRNSFAKLKEILVEKGTIDADEFDLACEAIEEDVMPVSNIYLRRNAN